MMSEWFCVGFGKEIAIIIVGVIARHFEKKKMAAKYKSIIKSLLDEVKK